jgi:hypothetical protein
VAESVDDAVAMATDLRGFDQGHRTSNDTDLEILTGVNCVG